MKIQNKLWLILFVLFAISPGAWAQKEMRRATIHCPYCSISNAATNKFCEACGARLPEPNVATQPSTADSNTNVPITRPGRSSAVQSEEASPAKALYEMSMVFVNENKFGEAAACFRRLASEHPDSDYARQSAHMARACEQLAQAQKQPEKTPVKAGPSNAAAFSGAFLGSLAGTLGSVLLIIAIASGN